MKGGRMMVTQKDVHNSIVVNASVWQKRYLSLQ
nr:MAG TPA: centrosomal targeting protein [Bacteriophage sp.]